MLARSEQALEEIDRQAQQHTQTRCARWGRLGFLWMSSTEASISGGDGKGAVLPQVSIVLAKRRIERMESWRRNIVSQTYPHLEVVLVLHNQAYTEVSVRESLAVVPILSVLRAPETCNLGTCINLGVAATTGEYVAKMDDDDFYGPSYISDLVLTALESGADITGKKTNFVSFEDSQEYILRGGGPQPLALATNRRGRAQCLPSAHFEFLVHCCRRDAVCEA